MIMALFDFAIAISYLFDKRWGLSAAFIAYSLSYLAFIWV